MARPASGQLVDSGMHVMVRNWLHPYIFEAASKVIVSYDRQEDRWQLLAVDESANARRSLNVVTARIWLPSCPGSTTSRYTTQSMPIALVGPIGCSGAGLRSVPLNERRN